MERTQKLHAVENRVLALSADLLGPREQTVRGQPRKAGVVKVERVLLFGPAGSKEQDPAYVCRLFPSVDDEVLIREQADVFGRDQTGRGHPAGRLLFAHDEL